MRSFSLKKIALILLVLVIAVAGSWLTVRWIRIRNIPQEFYPAGRTYKYCEPKVKNVNLIFISPIANEGEYQKYSRTVIFPEIIRNVQKIRRYNITVSSGINKRLTCDDIVGSQNPRKHTIAIGFVNHNDKRVEGGYINSLNFTDRLDGNICPGDPQNADMTGMLSYGFEVLEANELPSDNTVLTENYIRKISSWVNLEVDLLLSGCPKNGTPIRIENADPNHRGK
jgi:hypothetical protein